MSIGATPLAVSTGSERLPAFTFPETAVRALGRVVKYARWRAEPDGLLWGFDDVRADQARAICRHAVSARGTTWLTSEEVSQVLTAFALPEVDSHAVASGKQAAAVATRVGYPVVLKVLGPDILHKTERGAVAIDLANATQVENTFARLATDYPAAMTPGSGTSIVLQPMILHATELLVGATADPLFGPLVAVGLGGINAELVRDVGFRVAPITDKDADTLLRSLRSYPLLNGYRGRPPADVDAVRDVLMRLSALVTAVPEILELDFNPLMVLAAPHGCRIVDARIRVGPAAWS
jgi:acyl-CoA synthetase (NDP forming)